MLRTKDNARVEKSTKGEHLFFGASLGTGRVRNSCINFFGTSLLALSQVIHALSLPPGKRPQHISYRDSKLTRLLQPHLSGNALMAVLCCVSASRFYVEETRSTLRFAARAKMVQTSARVNEVVDPAAIVKKLREELSETRKALAEMQEHSEETKRVSLEATAEVKRLRDAVFRDRALLSSPPPPPSPPSAPQTPAPATDNTPPQTTANDETGGKEGEEQEEQTKTLPNANETDVDSLPTSPKSVSSIGISHSSAQLSITEQHQSSPVREKNETQLIQTPPRLQGRELPYQSPRKKDAVALQPRTQGSVALSSVGSTVNDAQTLDQLYRRAHSDEVVEAPQSVENTRFHRVTKHKGSLPPGLATKSSRQKLKYEDLPKEVVVMTAKGSGHDNAGDNNNDSNDENNNNDAMVEFLENKLESTEDLVESLLKDLESARKCVHELIFRNVRLGKRVEKLQRRLERRAKPPEPEIQQSGVSVEQYRVLKYAMYCALFFCFFRLHELFLSAVLFIWLSIEALT